jgi:hypothetical protein
MAEHAPITLGSFCWNELATSDAEACKDFYSQLLGWTAHTCEVGDTNYTMFKADGKDVGGMMQMGAEWGDTPPPPHWMAYVAVDDVDAVAARVESLGGRTCVPPTNIPTVGRFSVIIDPLGATFSLITLSNG